MENLLSTIFDISTFCFRTDSLLVLLPVGFAFVLGCVGIVFYLIRRI